MPVAALNANTKVKTDAKPKAAKAEKAAKAAEKAARKAASFCETGPSADDHEHVVDLDDAPRVDSGEPVVYIEPAKAHKIKQVGKHVGKALSD